MLKQFCDHIVECSTTPIGYPFSTLRVKMSQIVPVPIGNQNHCAGKAGPSHASQPAPSSRVAKNNKISLKYRKRKAAAYKDQANPPVAPKGAATECRLFWFL